MVNFSVDVMMAGGIPFDEVASGFAHASQKLTGVAAQALYGRRCPSAYSVSKASDDLPDPDNPVMTTNRLRGISTSIFFRLLTRAPFMKPIKFSYIQVKFARIFELQI